MTTWTKLETEQDRHRAVVAALDDEQRVQERGRHRLPCSQCGTEEGLVGWHYEVILEFIGKSKPLPREFREADHDPDKLYTVCPVCQAATAEVLEKTHAITEASELAEWLFQRQYGYIEPKQCRDLCKLAAQINMAWEVKVD